MSTVAQLAQPTFKAGPKDSLITKDVYSLNSTASVNNYASNSQNAPSTGLMGMMGSLAIQAAVPSILSKATGKAIPVQMDALARASNTLGSALGTAMRSLPTNISNPLTKALTVAGPAILSIAGAKTLIPGTKIPVVGVLGNMLNGVTKNNSLFSLQDKRSAITSGISLIDTNIKAGIPGTYGPIVNALAPDARSISNAIATGNLKSINKFSDVSSLSQVATITTKGLLKSTNPLVVANSLSNFIKPAPIKQIPVLAPVSKQSLETMTGLKTTYDLLDPNWNKTVTAAGNVKNISNLVNASPDARSVFNTGTLNDVTNSDKTALLAEIASKSNSSMTLTDQFPNVSFSNDFPGLGT